MPPQDANPTPSFGGFGLRHGGSLPQTGIALPCPYRPFRCCIVIPSVDLGLADIPHIRCGCPKNPPSFTTVTVGASTNAVNYPIGLTKPSLGAVN